MTFGYLLQCHSIYGVTTIPLSAEPRHLQLSNDVTSFLEQRPGTQGRAHSFSWILVNQGLDTTGNKKTFQPMALLEGKVDFYIFYGCIYT